MRAFYTVLLILFWIFLTGCDVQQGNSLVTNAVSNLNLSVSSPYPAASTPFQPIMPYPEAVTPTETTRSPVLTPWQTVTASNISLNPLPTERFDFNLINPEVAWAVTGQQAVLRTTDGGMTWRDVTPIGRAIYSLNVLDETHAWTISTSDPDPATAIETIYRTQDGGQSWEAFTAPFVMGDVHFLALKDGYAVASPMQCGAGTCWVELWQSKDGGETWEQLFITDPFGGAPDDRFPPGTVSIPSGQDFWFSDLNTIWEFGDYWIYPDLGKNILLKVSWDGGKTWQDQRATPPAGLPETAPNYVDHPVFLNQDEGYLAAYYTTRNNDGSIYQTWMAFYFTQDGGQTWVARPGILQLTQSYTGWRVVSTQDLFVRVGESLFTSKDGAQTWQPISSNLNFGSDQNQALVGFDFVDPLNGWALVTLPGDQYALIKTQDGGHNWESIQVEVTQP